MRARMRLAKKFNPNNSTDVIGDAEVKQAQKCFPVPVHGLNRQSKARAQRTLVRSGAVDQSMLDSFAKTQQTQKIQVAMEVTPVPETSDRVYDPVTNTSRPAIVFPKYTIDDQTLTNP